MAQTAKDKQRGPGRPPEGRAADGSPEPISRYPKLTINMEPSHRKRLAALATLTGKPAWRLVAEALSVFIAGLPAEDRRAVETLAKRSRREV